MCIRDRHTTDAPRKKAQANPTEVSLLKIMPVIWLSRIAFCPAVRPATPVAQIRMATIAIVLKLSCRITVPRIATITTSSFDNVVPTAKLLKENIQSRITVNRICATLPARA